MFSQAIYVTKMNFYILKEGTAKNVNFAPILFVDE